MTKHIVYAIVGLSLLWPGSAQAQLADPNQAGIAAGHMHLAAQDVPAAAKFFEAIGGTAMTADRIRFPGVVIMLRQGVPSGPSAGSSVDHIGFAVPNKQDALARWNAAGVKAETKGAFIYTPDGLTRLEIVQDDKQREPIRFHHIHFYAPAGEIPKIQQWYADMFGAVPGMRGRNVAADLPGVNLSFAAAEGAVAPSQGRAIDHIGFEVVGLQAFAKNLEAKGMKFDRPYGKGTTLMIAFLTDPWGTTIELTEGLRAAAQPSPQTSSPASSPMLLAALRASKKQGALAFIDPATGRILARVPTGEDPHGVTADAKMAYVANTTNKGGDSISIIDLAARKEVDRVQTGPGSHPHDILVTGGKVYFTAQGYKAVGRYDPATRAITWYGIGQRGPHMLTLSVDGKTLYAANPDSHSVAVIDGFAGTDWKLSFITVGGEGEGIDASPDGKEVWTADGEEKGGVSIINLATRQVQSVPLQTVHTNRLEISPDGKYVFVLDRSDNAELIIVDAASRKIVKRMKPGVVGSEKVDFDVRDVAFAPDASRAFVTTRKGTTPYIAVIDLKTLNMAGRIDLPIGADEMVWVR